MNSQLPPSLLGALRSVASEPQSDEVDLLDLGRTLWRGKLWIALAVLLFGAAGWTYGNRIAVPKYTAAATVVLEPGQAKVIDLEGVIAGISGDQMTVNTEAEVLTSRRLTALLVDEMGLTEDPEFNPYRDQEGPLPDPDIQRDVTIHATADAITVSNVRSSYVFQITAVTRAPRKSADLANTLADLYVADQLQVKFDATAQATEWLTDRVATLKTELEASETAVQSFTANTALVSPDALEALNRQIKDTRARLETLTGSRADLNDRLAALWDAIARRDTAAIAIAANDIALTQLVSSDAGTAAVIARAEAIAASLESDIARTNVQIASLSASVAQLEADFNSQSADLVELEQMKREAEASKAIYEYFLARMKETAVQQGIQQPDSRVLSYAAVPMVPSEPRKTRILTIWTVIGLLVGAGGVFLRELLNTGFRTAEQLEQRTGHPVFGQIPTIKGRKRRDIVGYLVEKPTSAASEAVRNLRTSILLSNVDNPPKVILSTSAMPGEGKTTVAIALAQNFSGLGRKVLLIEGDIRRRVFAEYFELGDSAGLLGVLSGEVHFEEAVQYVEKIGVDVLLGGMSTTNAADLFSSERFATLIRGLRKRYDIVIIDMPPVLLVPDTRIVAHVSDAVLFSVKWDHTSRAQVAEAIRQFEVAGRSITGLVLTQIDPRGMRRYGYGGRYGAYGGYSSKYYSS